MLNLQIRTTLPTLSKNNEPHMYDGDKVKQKHEASQKSNKFYYNRRYSSRSLPVLKKGDQDKKGNAWGRLAIVVGTANTPSSYDVQTESAVL
jgi:hypothetical protein